eukprot:CAMPEP_0183376926 /NCGR_PEP_ID=MMETSP0164_2-20130417/121655_1 /TAXON_ID=221442 /ORGANISM="Coccolithus pelagicus ssp braarudi, Strain PLY182g" /LENGTH=119 /DNA_ID=CAMNT_0025554329 /DNA_START=48 /DNA_END=403 /DNA_ORIENTATION=+
MSSDGACRPLRRSLSWLWVAQDIRPALASEQTAARSDSRESESFSHDLCGELLIATHPASVKHLAPKPSGPWCRSSIQDLPRALEIGISAKEMDHRRPRAACCLDALDLHVRPEPARVL